MSMTSKYSSSIYSDSFQLDDLLQQLSKQTRQQNIRTCQTLEQENEELRNELSQTRQFWDHIYGLMQEVANISAQLRTIKNEGVRLMIKQKKNWLVNCTEF